MKPFATRACNGPAGAVACRHPVRVPGSTAAVQAKRHYPPVVRHCLAVAPLSAPTGIGRGDGNSDAAALTPSQVRGTHSVECTDGCLLLRKQTSPRQSPCWGSCFKMPAVSVSNADRRTLQYLPSANWFPSCSAATPACRAQEGGKPLVS